MFGGSDSLNVERVALDMTNQEWMNIMLQGLNKKILEKITYQRNGLGNIPTNLQKVEINQSFWPRQKCYFIGEQNSTFNVLLSFVADAFGNTAQLQPQFLHPVSSTMTNLGTHLDQYIPSAYSLDWLKQKPLRVWLRICTKRLLFWVTNTVKYKYRKHKMTIFYQTYELEKPRGKNKEGTQRITEMWNQSQDGMAVPYFSMFLRPAWVPPLSSHETALI